MIIKQYTIGLPADYDMAIIRRRVADKGPAFDTLPGLGLKAFMISEKGRCGAPGNQYAPVYLWTDVAPMWHFVAGDGFRSVIDSFGRPPIHYWLGLAYARRPEIDLKTLRSVSREEERIEPGTDLKALRQGEIRQAREIVGAISDLAVRAVGLDVDRWSLVRFNYWAREQSTLPESATSYEVLHVSAPRADALD
jgi:hypothetical protein